MARLNKEKKTNIWINKSKYKQAEENGLFQKRYDQNPKSSISAKNQEFIL